MMYANWIIGIGIAAVSGLGIWAGMIERSLRKKSHECDKEIERMAYGEGLDLA